MIETAEKSRTEWIQQALEQFEGPLVRYARHIVGNWEEAKDVVQDTFMKLCSQNPEELDGHLTEWLFTVCRNRALDIKRKERRMATMTEELVVDSVSREVGPAAMAENQDSHGRILELMKDLPKNQHEVVRLKFQNGLSYKEISNITGLSVTNVGFLLHVGLKALRERLALS